MTTRTETAQAPAAFTPPAPPTAAEEAAAAGTRYFWLAGLGALLVAGLLFWRAHVLASILCALAGVSLPILARFFTSAAAMPIFAALVAAGAAFFVAWHLLTPKAPDHAKT